jgi:hypothetical protein
VGIFDAERNYATYETALLRQIESRNNSAQGVGTRIPLLPTDTPDTMSGIKKLR